MHSLCLFVWHSSYNQYKHNKERNRFWRDLLSRHMAHAVDPGSSQQTENHESGESEKCYLQAVDGVSTFLFLQSSPVPTRMILFPVVASNLWGKFHPLCAVLALWQWGLSGRPGALPVAAHPHQVEFMSWDRRQRQCHPELCPCSLIHHLHFGTSSPQRISFRKHLEVLPYKYYYKA